MNLGIRAVVVALALVCCGPAQAQILIARFDGTATLRMGDAPAAPVAKDRKEIPVGAQLRVGPGSTMVIGFPDGQVCVIGENSVFRVNAYRFEQGQADKGFVDLNLVSGSLRIAFGEIGTVNPAAVRVQMGAATLGVANNALAPTDASVVVLAGPMSVVVEAGRAVISLPAGQTQAVGAGQGMVLAQDGTVRLGNAAQLASLLGPGADAQEILKQMASLEGMTETIQQTIITLASLLPTADVLSAPALGTTATAGTAGAGGGGKFASPN